MIVIVLVVKMSRKVKYILALCFLIIISVDSAFAVNLNDKVSCGSIGSFHRKIPELTSWFITIIQIAVPVVLVIIGSIDFVKALSSQKDEEIKKGQQMFIKRIFVAVLIFFAVVIVKALVSLVSGDDSESKGIIGCIDCFISNNCG